MEKSFRIMEFFREKALFRNEEKPLHPFWVMVYKEWSDQVRSWRFIILSALMALTCMGSLYTALMDIGEAVKPNDPDGAFFFLVGQDLREGDAGGVVDADMDELPAGATGLALLRIAGDAMADLAEAAELL